MVLESTEKKDVGIGCGSRKANLQTRNLFCQSEFGENMEIKFVDEIEKNRREAR